MVKRILLLIMLCPALVTSADAQRQGVIKGRAALKGEVVPGVSILAFKDSDTIDLNKPDYVMGPTAIDGSYEFRLPPDKYYFIAIKKAVSGKDFTPENGDLYCFYSGSPVEAVANSVSYVGFNLIKVRSGGKDKRGAGDTGIYGKVTFDGKPLQRSYVYVYKDLRGGFRGPAYQVFPSIDGKFKIHLPPGAYYALARKRNKGGMYGPIEEGDYFNVYHGNPVTVTNNVMKYIEIESVKRLSQLEGDIGFPVVQGIVADKEKRGIGGLFVLFYQTRNMQGKPLYISSRTNDKGEFTMKLPAGMYYLLARENIGGPPMPGEWTGKYAGELIVPEKGIPDKIHIGAEKTK